jgi:hypothetical protein
MDKYLSKLAATAMCSLGLIGCIHQESTVIQDVPRTRVEFENDAAARLFYEGLHRASATYKDTQTTHVDLPIVFHHSRKVVTGPNVAFNKAVDICDSNKDARITEIEARIYNEQNCKRL